MIEDCFCCTLIVCCGCCHPGYVQFALMCMSVSILVRALVRYFVAAKQKVGEDVADVASAVDEK